MILVDTDLLIDITRGYKPSREILESLGQEHELAISQVTQMELTVGCRNQHELRSLDSSLESFLRIPLNSEMADVAVALLRRYCLSHGLLIPDALIAAAAISRGIPFLSKNQRDFRFMDALDLLPYPPPL